eukprot:4785441-Amphidinium_carterae.1
MLEKDFVHSLFYWVTSFCPVGVSTRRFDESLCWDQNMEYDFQSDQDVSSASTSAPLSTE